MYNVITYDAPHRKTQDLLLKLKSMGINDVTVVATPWEEKKSFTPLIPHRPVNHNGMPPEVFSENLGYKFMRRSIGDLYSFFLDQKPEAVLIAGAGILPKDLVEGFTVINSHPGYLPNVRGLDALKWAIYEGQPIGVTVHVASPEADAGLLIKREIVPLYHWDTFHSLAYRQYEMEISLLAASVNEINKNPPKEIINVASIPVHRRMPHSHETRLMERFQRLVNSVPISQAQNSN